MTRHPATGRRRPALLAALLTLAAAIASLLVTAGPAAAATARDGVCESGEFCFYYHSGETGSISDFTGSLADYQGTSQPDCYEFRTPGRDGYHHCMKNNAASAWNRASVPVTVFFNTGYGGHSQTFAPGQKGQLDSTLYNQNASHRFGSKGGGTVSGSTAVSRAQVWVDKHIPYSMSKTYQGYRTDCSGYVSMAWGLPKPGLVTNTMHTVGSSISKSSLKQGDALLNPASGAHGHIVLFQKWANSAHSSYWGYEETGSHGAIHRTIPYPYFQGYGTFTPFRYKGLK